MFQSGAQNDTGSIQLATQTTQSMTKLQRVSAGTGCTVLDSSDRNSPAMIQVLPGLQKMLNTRKNKISKNREQFASTLSRYSQMKAHTRKIYPTEQPQEHQSLKI